MMGIIAALPAVEGLRTYAKISAGETGIVIVALIIVKPL